MVPALLFLASACSDGPSGPGTLDATVEAPTQLGGVVLELTGPGITGFVGQGDTQAYGAVVSELEGRHRVILISQGSGTLRFGVQVEDLAAELPTVQVISATTLLNQPALLTGIVASVALP